MFIMRQKGNGVGMNFEEALKALRSGKSVKLPHLDFYLTCISKIYYDNNPDRPCEILSTECILRDDWEIA